MRALTMALVVSVLGVLGLAGLGTLGASGCGAKSPPPSDKPAPITEPANNCTTSDDCDLVDACCGCNAGGKKLAIRKDAVAGFMASREQRCANVMCAQMISTDPSCDAEAICGSRNRCRVAPHMQH
jgi:hypothetical protein